VKSNGQLIAVSILLAFLMTTCLAGSAVVQESGQQITLQEVGQIDTPGFARDVVVKGDIAYVADMGTAFGSSYGGLFIFNISDPSNPMAMGHFYDGGRSHQIVLLDEVALVTDNTGGLEIFNISDPWNPDKISQFDANYINDLAVQGTTVYVTDMIEGVIVLDISNLTNPMEIGRFETEFVQPITLVDNIIYLGGGEGLRVLNATDPSKITNLTYYDYNFNRVQFNGNTAYMTCSGSWLEHGPNDGFWVLDISDPLNFIEQGSYHDGGNLIDLHINKDRNIAIISDLVDGVGVLDISDLSNIKKIVNYYDGGNATDMHVVGDLIFVADGPDGLEILEITIEDETSSTTSTNSVLGFELLLAIMALLPFLVTKKNR
jgi:hypothetical protein